MSTEHQPTKWTYRWECPSCGDEGYTNNSEATFCGICAADNGRDVRLRVSTVARDQPEKTPRHPAEEAVEFWTPKRMTKREARRWVQLHWAAFMASADLPDPVPQEVEDVWLDESDRMAQRIASYDEIAAWRAANGM
jgi:hypothetical protein